MTTEYAELWEINEPVTSFGVEVPEFIKCNTPDISPYDLAGVTHGGCASGAYMPAVTYATAVETMGKHGDDVLEFIEDNAGELPKIPEGTSWDGVAVLFLSHAVEMWASGAADEIEEILEAREEETETLKSEWPEIRAMIVEQYGEDDEPALNEGFNNWTDSLCKDGRISEWVYENVTREEIES